MTNSLVERELKFDVEPDFVIPDITALIPAGGRIEDVSEQLQSDYFDTADRALLAAHMTLRKRTGTNDTGWHLKIPHPPFREEIRVELTDGDDVPDQLRQLLLGVSRGQSLSQIASLRTERHVTRLLDAAGRRLAEIDDDTVHAVTPGESATVSTWREVEIELGDDETDLLDALGEQLRAAGAQASGSSSKLARALPKTDTAPAGSEPETLRARDVIRAYLAEQQQAILAGDLGLRRGDDGVIHKTRVATRRTRSALRIYGTLFDAKQAASLDGELRWYAGVLGEVRDRQVLQKRLDTMLDDVDVALQLGPVRARVDSELSQERAEHWQSLQQALSDTRYLALLSEINAWVIDAPWTSAADEPAKTITELVAAAEGKVSRRLEQANASGDIEELHDARKAAKRARYAAEAAAPVIGEKAAADHAARYQQLQDLLGEHQDSQVSAELLRRLGAKAGDTPGENGFTFGILHEREEQAARAARDKARRTARKYR